MKKGKRSRRGPCESVLEKGRTNETLTVLRFHKPIGVLRAILKRDCVAFMLVGNSSKRSDPLEEIPSKDMSESNSKLKSLILAQNERWRQA